jgi:hypothetical protein
MHLSVLDAFCIAVLTEYVREASCFARLPAGAAPPQSTGGSGRPPRDSLLDLATHGLQTGPNIVRKVFIVIHSCRTMVAVRCARCTARSILHRMSKKYYCSTCKTQQCTIAPCVRNEKVGRQTTDQKFLLCRRYNNCKSKWHPGRYKVKSNSTSSSFG